MVYHFSKAFRASATVLYCSTVMYAEKYRFPAYRHDLVHVCLGSAACWRKSGSTYVAGFSSAL